MRTEFSCFSVSGPRVKLVDCKSALPRPPELALPLVVYIADFSRAVVPGLLLLCVGL